ncbi:MAG: cytochrome c1 [Proteobacteria bacterium]|nr:cytochrome c1 [Pseudomonadota bacterium]
MNKQSVMVILCLVAINSTMSPVLGSDPGMLENSGVNFRDKAAIQRGAKWFVNYCLSCHSASYMRYNRLAEDLDLDQDLVLRNLAFADVNIGDTMEIAMRPKDSEAWLGKTPPDLSVISRSRGNDWLFTYLKSFYRDENGGWNNLLLPNPSMPHVFWQLQGIQEPVWSSHNEERVIEHLELTSPGLQSPQEYEQTVRDLVTFLDYLGEPSKLKRKNIGIWVMLFLVVFTLVAYALKVEYWRDVH